MAFHLLDGLVQPFEHPLAGNAQGAGLAVDQTRILFGKEHYSFGESKAS